MALLVARGLPNREVAAAFATAGPIQIWGEGLLPVRSGLYASAITASWQWMISPESSAFCFSCYSASELLIWRTARDSNPQPPDP